MSKYTIQSRLTAETLLAAVPRLYRPQLHVAGPDEEYTLLLFRNAREDVVLSATVEKALADLPEAPGTLVAVGGCFTAEGLEMLSARQAIVLQLSDFGWTDEGYKRIRETPLTRSRPQQPPSQTGGEQQ